MTRRKKAEDKKRFRAVGISNKLAIEQQAQKLEDALNELVSDGYKIQSIEVESRGVVVVGELVGPPQSLPDFLQSVGLTPLGMAVVPASHPPQERKENKNTKRVISMIAACDGVPPSKRTEALTEMMRNVSNSLPAAECIEIAEDLVREALKHEEEGHHNNECEFSKLVRESADILRSIAQPRVN